MRNSENKGIGIIIFILLILAAIGGIFLYGKLSKKIVSPIPPESQFKVIYYTPTPVASTPTSTPSATPKIKNTSTPVPTLAPTLTTKPSASGSATVTQ